MGSYRSFKSSAHGQLLAASMCDHLVQFYEQDNELLDSLEKFVAKALLAGEASVVIATPEHRQALRDRFRSSGIDIDQAVTDQTYTELDARETLDKFIRDDWPDPEAFEQIIREVLISVRGDGRNIRAFGEMVSLLWHSDQKNAALRLEHLWNNLIRAEDISLFCAYPSTVFDAADRTGTIEEICAAHRTVVGRRFKPESLAADEFSGLINLEQIS
jgi:hypothetical protein